MTITPVAAPAVPQVPGAASAGSGQAGEQFAALVQQHLDDSSSDARVSGEEAAALLQAASTSGPVSDGVAAMLAGLLGADVGGAVLGGAVSGTAGTTAAAEVEGAAGGSVTGPTTGLAGSGLATGAPVVVAAVGAALPGLPAIAGGALATWTGPAGLVPDVELPAAGASAAAGGASVAAGGASVVGGTGSDLAGPSSAPGAVDPALLVGMQVVPSAADNAVAPAERQVVTGTENTATVPFAAAGPSTTAGADALAGAPGTGDGSTRSSAVTDQVFPQVARLVSRGDGVHRLMLRLHPADLGEVKVVLTVKDNVVDVTLSGSAAAREALQNGSPQLRSLLELAGATTGQLVVRELTSTGPTAASAQLGQGGSGGQSSGHQGEQMSTGDDAGRDGPGNPDTQSGLDGRPGDGRSSGAAGLDVTGGSRRQSRTGPPGSPLAPGASRPVAHQSASQLDLDL